MDSKRTPGTLSRNIPPITKYPTLFAGRNTHVAQIVSKNEADADFIVRAWNAHDDLVRALRDLLVRAEAELADPEDVWEVGAAHQALAKACEA